MRESSRYYTAPSAITISQRDSSSPDRLVVDVAEGATIRVFVEEIYDLGIVDSSFRSWSLTGRNQHLGDISRPYTIYARLNKSDTTDGYLVFAPKEYTDNEWKDPYELTPNTSTEKPIVARGNDGKKRTWGPISKRQADKNRSDYWWLKLGDVSREENGRRTVTIDTGILGTDQYNAQWDLRSDDLPSKAVRTILEDRGAWESEPKVTYTGTTGKRTPDGTLTEYIAAALGWTGEEELSFTHNQQIDEPYHHQGITRNRWITQRLSDDNNALTDVELYEQLTTDTRGWEEENTIEVSRVWNRGALWECLVDGTTQEPWFDSTDWQYVSGGVFSLGFYSWGDNPTPILGLAVRPASVDEKIVPYLLFGQEDASDMVTAWQWKRESNYEALDEAWGNSARTDAADYPDQRLKSAARMLHLTTDDLPANWDTAGGRVGFTCTATFPMGGDGAQIMNTIRVI